MLALPRTRRVLFRSVAGTAVGLLFLVLVWRALGRTLSWRGLHVEALSVVLAVVGALGFLAARGWRYSVLLPQRRPGARRLLGVTSVSWAIGLLVPGPSADAAFIGLARANLGVSAARATGVSLVARLLDVVSLGVVAVVAAALSSVAEPMAVVVTAGLVAAATGLVLVLSFMGGPRRVVLRRLARVPRLTTWMERTDRNLEDLSGRPRAVRLVASTALCRVATAVEYAALFSLVDLHLSFWQVWFALAIRSFFIAIPIQGIAGIGTSQAWWTAALVLEGIPAAQAVPASVTLQVIDLVIGLGVSALVAAATVRTWRRPSEADAEAGAPEQTVTISGAAPGKGYATPASSR